MQRNAATLVDGEFDLAIIGGGAFGAAAAWDASLRGLRTVLIERNDFGGGSSAECFKMVHGGIRYLQHMDIPRLRSSCQERSALLRIAPHLVSPLPDRDSDLRPRPQGQAVPRRRHVPLRLPDVRPQCAA